MPQAQHVVGKLAHRGAVVDAHPRDAGQPLGLVHHYGRQPALQDHLQVGIFVAHRIHHETVHAGRKHSGCAVFEAAAGSDGHQQQPLPQRLARLRHPGDEVPRGGVAEEIGQRFGHHQTDRAGLAGPQRSRHRVGAGVSQPLGRREHALTQVRGELIGPVEGIRNRRAGNVELIRQRRQGRTPARWGAHVR
jgi:hypothetical protein